jgi:hypothetical protein
MRLVSAHPGDDPRLTRAPAGGTLASRGPILAVPPAGGPLSSRTRLRAISNHLQTGPGPYSGLLGYAHPTHLKVQDSRFSSIA